MVKASISFSLSSNFLKSLYFFALYYVYYLLVPMFCTVLFCSPSARYASVLKLGESVVKQAFTQPITMKLPTTSGLDNGCDVTRRRRMNRPC